MSRINLISSSRRQARLHRARCRSWGIGFVAYTAVIVSACMFYRGLDAFGDTTSLNDQLAGLDTELAQIEQEKAGIMPELTEQRLVLTSAQSITDQPDWSLLLVYLADEVLGDDVILAGCTLEPDEELARGPEVRNASMTVKLSGHAKTTPAVSQFVLRLEESGLFDRVTLVNTNREPFMDGQAIAFEIDCLISNAGGGS